MSAAFGKYQNFLELHMSNVALVRAIQSPFLRENVPQIRTGMEVEVHQTIKDGEKTRTQKFKGLVIHTRGKSPLEQTIVVRKDVDGIGIEKIFAIHSPTISKIEVLRSFKVRHKNIAFIRALRGKAARLKEVK
jgi:large subunit ribosomal protein L19